MSDRNPAMPPVDAEARTDARRLVESVGPGEYVTGSVLHTSDELNAETIRLAIRFGWRGASAEDFREIRRLLAVSEVGGPDLCYWHPSADEQGVSEALGWVAEDAVSYLNDEIAPEGHAFYFEDGLILANLEEDAETVSDEDYAEGYYLAADLEEGPCRGHHGPNLAGSCALCGMPRTYLASESGSVASGLILGTLLLGMSAAMLAPFLTAVGSL